MHNFGNFAYFSKFRNLNSANVWDIFCVTNSEQVFIRRLLLTCDRMRISPISKKCQASGLHRLLHEICRANATSVNVFHLKPFFVCSSLFLNAKVLIEFDLQWSVGEDVYFYIFRFPRSWHFEIIFHLVNEAKMRRNMLLFLIIGLQFFLDVSSCFANS